MRRKPEDLKSNFTQRAKQKARKFAKQNPVSNVEIPIQGGDAIWMLDKKCWMLNEGIG